MPPNEAGKPISILIADDDVAIRTMIRQILAHEGYDVTVVNDGSEAVKKIPEVMPDLILTDVKMPNMDGYQVCQAVKGNPALKQDWYNDPKSGEPVDFITFARTEGRFARHFDAQGQPDESLKQAQQGRLENWRLLQELAGVR